MVCDLARNTIKTQVMGGVGCYSIIFSQLDTVVKVWVGEDTTILQISNRRTCLNKSALRLQVLSTTPQLRYTQMLEQKLVFRQRIYDDASTETGLENQVFLFLFFM